MTYPFQVGDVTIGGGAFFLIAGPCVIESEAHALKMAEAIAAVAHDKKLPYIFKASYDKANRTSIRSFRGPGLEEGLRILRKVRETANIPVLTDVHEAADVPRVAEVVDVLQIPAFLCRQTDLLVAAGKSGCAVNIKKGQFVSPWDMQHAVEKVREAGGERVFLTERGVAFGYNNLVVDMRSLAIMRKFAPVVFDATHSVQLPRQEWPTVMAAGCKAAGSRSSSLCLRVPLWLPVWTVSSSRCTTILPRRCPMAQMRMDLKLLPELLDQLIAVRNAVQ